MRSKVLVVDDIEVDRDLLGEILDKDYGVVKAQGGREALELLDQNDLNIVVVLLDLLMPEMDGFAVLEAMKERGLMGKIPVLVISAEQSAEVEEKCFEYGVSDFIRKPFEAPIIRRRVKNIVDLFAYKLHLEERVEIQAQALCNQYRLLKEQAEEMEKEKKNSNG